MALQTSGCGADLPEPERLLVEVMLMPQAPPDQMETLQIHTFDSQADDGIGLAEWPYGDVSKSDPKRWVIDFTEFADERPGDEFEVLMLAPNKDGRLRGRVRATLDADERGVVVLQLLEVPEVCDQDSDGRLDCSKSFCCDGDEEVVGLNDRCPSSQLGADDDEGCALDDDECAGLTWNDVAMGEACTPGDPCSPGTVICWAENGEPEATCDSLKKSAEEGGPGIEVCNGVDDDCDGDVDESEQDLGEACPDEGACKDGVWECRPDGRTCSTHPGGTADMSGDEVCDGIDNDCDPGTAPDEGCVETECSEDGGCDDSDACTSDSCVEESCVYAPMKEGEACGVDLVCNNSSDCVDKVCESNANYCDADVVKQCNSIGTGADPEAEEENCADTNSNCVNGACIDPDCVPDCQGKECGDDGCNGLCGPCALYEYCSQIQTCLEKVCEPNALYCAENFTMTCNADGSAGEEGSDCSELGQTCADGKCSCIPSCDDKECGDDGCGGSCGTCGEADEECNPSGQCAALCVPDCDDKSCGTDGCGGLCTGCAVSEECTDAQLCKAYACEGLEDAQAVSLEGLQVIESIPFGPGLVDGIAMHNGFVYLMFTEQELFDEQGPGPPESQASEDTTGLHVFSLETQQRVDFKSYGELGGTGGYFYVQSMHIDTTAEALILTVAVYNQNGQENSLLHAYDISENALDLKREISLETLLWCEDCWELWGGIEVLQGVSAGAGKTSVFVNGMDVNAGVLTLNTADLIDPSKAWSDSANAWDYTENPAVWTPLSGYLQGCEMSPDELVCLTENNGSYSFLVYGLNPSGGQTIPGLTQSDSLKSIEIEESGYPNSITLRDQVAVVYGDSQLISFKKNGAWEIDMVSTDPGSIGAAFLDPNDVQAPYRTVYTTPSNSGAGTSSLDRRYVDSGTFNAQSNIKQFTNQTVNLTSDSMYGPYSICGETDNGKTRIIVGPENLEPSELTVVEFSQTFNTATGSAAAPEQSTLPLTFSTGTPSSLSALDNIVYAGLGKAGAQRVDLTTQPKAMGMAFEDVNVRDLKLVQGLAVNGTPATIAFIASEEGLMTFTVSADGSVEKLWEIAQLDSAAIEVEIPYLYVSLAGGNMAIVTINENSVQSDPSYVTVTLPENNSIETSNGRLFAVGSGGLLWLRDVGGWGNPGASATEPTSVGAGPISPPGELHGVSVLLGKSAQPDYLYLAMGSGGLQRAEILSVGDDLAGLGPLTSVLEMSESEEVVSMMIDGPKLYVVTRGAGSSEGFEVSQLIQSTDGTVSQGWSEAQSGSFATMATTWEKVLVLTDSGELTVVEHTCQ